MAPRPNESTEKEPSARARPLFPRWSNTLLRVSFACAFALAVGLPAFFVAWARTPYATGESDPIKQPVMFDHRHHVRDDGIDCRYCHGAVDRSAYAGVPATEVCMSCHGQIWNQAPLLAEVRASFFGGKPIVWERVHNLPDHVFFNHAVHVNRGVGCVTCHGRVDQMAVVSMVAPMTMRWCLDCHRHPEDELRPADKITDLAWVPPPGMGEKLAKERGIAPPTYCSGCHR